MVHFSPAHLLAGTCVLLSAGVLTQKVTTCYCGTVHRLSCDTGVISVQTALWGHEDERCFHGQPPYPVNQDCSPMGTVENLKTRCDGKKVCELTPADIRYPGSCTGYLHTTYTCIPANYLVTCEHSLAYLQCDKGQVIHVYSADYGRRDRTTCIYNRPYSQIQKTDCSSPSSKVAESCNGKNSCIIKVSNSVFGDPCKGTYKYLEASYMCQDALTPSNPPSESPSEPPSEN
uniref:SUEL-type lectin domain-containing protein n=1 Tax=Sphaeramia orbicularis TaxID=375764 RepID=A0A672YXB0_9TELE